MSAQAKEIAEALASLEHAAMSYAQIQDTHSNRRLNEAREQVLTKIRALASPPTHGWTIGPLTPDIGEILGSICFRCVDIANVLRRSGQAIDTKAEAEQAAAIHYKLGFYAQHGADWWQHCREDLSLKIDAAKRAATAQQTGGAV